MVSSCGKWSDHKIQWNFEVSEIYGEGGTNWGIVITPLTRVL